VLDETARRSYTAAIPARRSSTAVLAGSALQVGVPVFLAVLLLVAVARGAGPAGAAAQQVPKVNLRWSMPSRYELGWQSWDSARNTYAAGYVRPRTWAATFDLCSTSGGLPITRYILKVTGAGFTYSSSDRNCIKRIVDLPRLGTYDVLAAAASSAGLGPTVTTRVTLRDYLIVSLGDSFASGEGSADRPGDYLVRIPSTPAAILGFGIAVRELRHVEWKDERCHRSAKSGHALLAKAIEDRDAHSSVTFVSLACSGAETLQGLLGPYAGSEPPENVPALPAQVEVLSQLVPRLGPSVRLPGARPIDVLLLQIGINDLGFSSIIKTCATNVNLTTRCFPTNSFSDRLAKLRTRYEQVGRALADRFPGADVYIADYPAKVFDGGACGALGRPNIGITSGEAREMAYAGTRFAEEIQRAAVAWGWNYVGGTTEFFADHAYCSPTRWFTTFELSYEYQGNDKGTAHPNPSGYQAFAQHLDHAVVAGREREPAYRLQLVIEKARWGSSLDYDERPYFQLRVRTRDDGLLTPTTTFHLGVAGALLPPAYDDTLKPLPRVPTYDLPIYSRPQPGRFLTELAFTMKGKNCEFAVRHGASTSYGQGVHTLTAANGLCELQYRVELSRAAAAKP
jgi:lysophospholipase L1-like esterase